MLLIASRRKLGHRRRHKRQKSDQTHYLAVSRHTEATSTDLVTDIGQAAWVSHVANAGARHGVLVYVHGFNTPQKTMLARHYRIKHHVRQNGFEGAVIAFDWPSFASKWQYSADRDLATAVAPFLISDVVSPIKQAVPSAKVHLIAHSMGAMLTVEALKTRPGDLSFDQISFVSADVDASAFAPNAADWTTLTGACARFTNYCSGTDRVLKVPGTFVSGLQARLGQRGLPNAGPGATFDVDGQHRFAHFKKRNNARHSHTWWFEDAFFFKDLSKTLAGTDAQDVATRLSTHHPPRQILRSRP